MHILGLVDFLVLGPLRVEDGDVAVNLGGPKRRTLLALLVAAAGEAVSTDALVMGVYGPDAAPRSRRSIHTYISAFRREMGDVVRRVGNGYALDVSPVSIDAIRFEHSLRDAAAMADETAAADLLRLGLQLWRGAPYADVELPTPLQVEVRRLEGLRAEALEARIDLDLQAGRHAQLVGEMAGIVAEYPLREGLWSRQMLAMYRCGRQSDALRAYHQARTRLRDELGLDPSPQLQRLEQQILAHDPSLEYRPRPRARPLPSRYTSFVGRTEEMAAVEKLLQTHRLVTITGPGGIGKSALAAETARKLAKSMKVVYVPVERNRATDLLLLIAQSVGLSPTFGADLIEVIARSLGERPTLLLLDGCEHVISDLPGPVAEMLRRCPAIVVLITSREGLFIAGEGLHRLGPLDLGAGSAANELFADRTGLRLNDLDDEELGMVTRVGERTSGLPLGIELVAARFRTMPLDVVLSRLDDQVSLLAVSRGADERHLSISAALEASYQSLDPALQAAFRRLGVFRFGVPEEAARAVLEDDHAELILQTLVDLSLLEPKGLDGRHVILEPLRQYAESLLEGAGESFPAELAYAEWTADFWWKEYLHFEMTQSARLYDLLRVHGPETASITGWAVNNGRPQVALSIVAAVGRWWSRVLDAGALIDAAKRALAHPDAIRDELYVQALAQTAWLARITDPDLSGELLAEVESLAPSLQDLQALRAVTDVRAALRQVLHNRWLDDSLMTEALSLHDELFGHAEALGRPPEAHLSNHIILLDELGRLDESDAELERLTAWIEAAAPHLRGDALHHRGIRELMGGRFTEAAESLREAARAETDLQTFAGALNSDRALVGVLVRSGRPEDALAAIDRCNDYNALLGWPAFESFNPESVAPVMSALGRWDVFVDAMCLWIDQSVPASTDERTWTAFLEGRYVVGSSLVELLYPTARWLVEQGREQEAAALVRAAPMAFERTKFVAWTEVGARAEIETLADELHGVVAEPPKNLDELFWLVARLFRPDAQRPK